MAGCGLAPIQRFTFYDHVHTTGLDVPQAPCARAALTLGKDHRCARARSTNWVAIPCSSKPEARSQIFGGWTTNSDIRAPTGWPPGGHTHIPPFRPLSRHRHATSREPCGSVALKLLCGPFGCFSRRSGAGPGQHSPRSWSALEEHPQSLTWMYAVCSRHLEGFCVFLFSDFLGLHDAQRHVLGSLLSEAASGKWPETAGRSAALGA